ncbi:MAG: P1 family peptidase [Trueperaceae bacterium]|nr:P1 family peptidase [Trueperaceae bacterium]
MKARALGVPFSGNPGTHNDISDVSGVEVGHCTLIAGDGPLIVGKGPVRTGVTAILPRGKTYKPCFAGWFSLNGNGEMTGTTWLTESGFLEGPIMLTNTHSLGTVRDSLIKWQYEQGFYDPFWNEDFFLLPVVAETFDGMLNDINGFHVKEEHVYQALANASSGPIEEGNVGSGTGMICHEFKGGIGSSSRILASGYHLGVLVQANYGARELLTVAGVPVGKQIPDLKPRFKQDGRKDGSIIIVVATDAPLLPHQLNRLAKRAALGLAKVGGIGSNSSGDIFIAFSTANPEAAHRHELRELVMLPNDQLNPLFEATVQATEEAIINAMTSAQTMTGIHGNTVYALPHDRLNSLLNL